MRKIIITAFVCLLAAGCSSTSPGPSPLSRALDFPTGVTPECSQQAAARVPGILLALDRHLLAGGELYAAGMLAALPLIEAYGDKWPSQFEAAEYHLDIAIAIGPWLSEYYGIVKDQISEGEWAALVIGTVRNAMATYKDRQPFIDEVRAVECVKV